MALDRDNVMVVLYQFDSFFFLILSTLWLTTWAKNLISIRRNRFLRSSSGLLIFAFHGEGSKDGILLPPSFPLYIVVLFLVVNLIPDSYHPPRFADLHVKNFVLPLIRHIHSRPKGFLQYPQRLRHSDTNSSSRMGP